MVLIGRQSITIASGFQKSVPDHTTWQGPCGNDPSQCDTTGNRYQALKVNVLLENYLSPDGWRACLRMRQGIDSSSSSLLPYSKYIHTCRHTQVLCPLKEYYFFIHSPACWVSRLISQTQNLHLSMAIFTVGIHTRLSS